MISFTAPTVAALRSWGAAQHDAPFSYADVGATRSIDDGSFVAPAGFVFDRRRVLLGTGDHLYAAARSALSAGRMFPQGWLRVAWPEQPIVPGAIVALAARCGVWWWNAARIVAVENAADASRNSVAYGTLTSHVESGEERFLVEQLLNGEVWYEIAAFSRPRHPLVRLAYPLARRMQHRFGRDSAAAMLSAVRELTLQCRRSETVASVGVRNRQP